MTEPELPFDEEKAERLFQQRDRMLASVTQVSKMLSEQADKLGTVTAGMLMLQVGQIGLPDQQRDEMLAAIDKYGRSLVALKTVIVATKVD